ncbi:MAG: HXXEE domain-containing protein [Eubacterium sp.]|nr:HXXEE domain-containing protein [Eubacterium sp.]
MKGYILLLPIIFIFHDMEEIVGFEWFFRRNPNLYDRFPRVMKDFIDRGHFVIEQLLHGKACVIVATGENYGNKDAAKVLKNLVISIPGSD